MGGGNKVMSDVKLQIQIAPNVLGLIDECVTHVGKNFPIHINLDGAKCHTVINSLSLNVG